MKNNITRMLDSRGIPYKTHQLPAKKLSAGEAAELLQISPDLVYKTIVVTRLTKGKHILAVVPGPLEVDLKALAKALGEKKLKLATERQAERITGLQAGVYLHWLYSIEAFRLYWMNLQHPAVKFISPGDSAV